MIGKSGYKSSLLLFILALFLFILNILEIIVSGISYTTPIIEIPLTTTLSSGYF